MLSNEKKDTEYINKLIEMKRYYRSDKKFLELVKAADEQLVEADYAHTWDLNRREMIKYLKELFQLDMKSASYIKFTNVTDETNNDSYSFQIEIGKSPIPPEYAIGTDTELTV
jgi:hypothetical protein